MRGRAAGIGPGCEMPTSALLPRFWMLGVLFDSVIHQHRASTVV